MLLLPSLFLHIIKKQFNALLIWDFTFTEREENPSVFSSRYIYKSSGTFSQGQISKHLLTRHTISLPAVVYNNWNPVGIWYTLFVTLPKSTGSDFVWQRYISAFQYDDSHFRFSSKKLFSLAKIILLLPEKGKPLYYAVSAPGIPTGELADDPGKWDGCFSWAGTSEVDLPELR